MVKEGDIKAKVRFEERYAGLLLDYSKHTDLKEEILNKIEEVKKEMELPANTPEVVENCDPSDPQKCALYIEFQDDYDRVSGEFFDKLLKKLCIKECE